MHMNRAHHTRTGASLAAVVVCVATMSAASGCVTANRWIEVQLVDTERVDVNAPDRMQVVKAKGDVLVDGTSVLDEQSMKGRRAATIVRRVPDSLDELRVSKGGYGWKRGPVTLSTPKDNIKSAELATRYTQPRGTLPSLGAMVAGSMFALGFGVAGGASLADAASGNGTKSENDASLAEGIGLTTAAVAGAGLLTYGIVTFVMVTQSPYYEPLAVVAAETR